MADGGRKNADSVLVTALASGVTVRDAAATAGVGETTVYRCLKEPELRRRVYRAQSEMVGQAAARLSAARTSAADTLKDLLTAESETVRLGAARSILELGMKLREQEDLAERVAALEGQLSPDQGGALRWAG